MSEQKYDQKEVEQEAFMRCDGSNPKCDHLIPLGGPAVVCYKSGTKMTWDWEVYQSEIPAPEALGELRFFCRKSIRGNDEQIGEHIREENSECRGGCPYNFGIVLSFLGTFLKRYPAGSFKDRLASKPEEKAYQF